MNWNIQKAQISDAEAIAGFQLAMAMESEGLALDEGTVLNGVQAALGDPSKGLYFVARDEKGAIAGSLFLTKEWSDWHNCDYWWIQSVYVLPEYRRRGVFSSLYSHVRGAALSEGVTSLRLYVDRENRNAQSIAPLGNPCISCKPNCPELFILILTRPECGKENGTEILRTVSFPVMHAETCFCICPSRNLPHCERKGSRTEEDTHFPRLGSRGANEFPGGGTSHHLFSLQEN